MFFFVGMNHLLLYLDVVLAGVLLQSLRVLRVRHPLVAQLQLPLLQQPPPLQQPAPPLL